MSFDDFLDSKRFKKRKEKSIVTDDYLKQFFKKYNVEYTSNIEELSISLALGGQEALAKNNLNSAEEISTLLDVLSKQWKDDFIKMKSQLLKSEIAGYKNKDKIQYLEKALFFAKKNKIPDIEFGIRIQLAFEKHRIKDYKGVLQEIKILEKYPEIIEENKRVIYELKSRVYWEIDNYVKGFEATLKWYQSLKVSFTDLHSLFMTIVYILTVMNSLSLPYPKEEQEKIKQDIISLLSEIASSVHLLPQILPYIDILFAKSLMLVEPQILYTFTNLLLQTARWNDEEKYLHLCQRLSDAYQNLDEYEKSIELMNKAHKYAKEKKYSKIEKIIQYKKAEISSLIFYFMNFDALFDPWMIKSVVINQNNDSQEELFLKTLSSGTNTFPTTSYSKLLNIIEKASSSYIKENSLKLIGLNPKEERCFFVLDLEMADDKIRILIREDFNIETKEFHTLHSTLTPYYSVIGLITKEKREEITEIYGIEEVLIRLQRVINCPASKATIYLPKKSPHLNLFRFYLQEGGFRDLKIKLIDSAMSLGKKYDFTRKEDFLKIFQADPITIFDLSLRNSDLLQPLTNLLNQAYNLRISNKTLSEFFADTIQIFLKRGDTRFWKEFYYQYAWLHTRGLYLTLANEEINEKQILIEKIILFSKLLGESEKILESFYFKALINLIENSKESSKYILDFKNKSNEIQDKKYVLISNVLEKFENINGIVNENILVDLLDNFCELCEYRDWEISSELFIYLLTKLPEITTLFEICKDRDIKDAGLYLYLHLSKHMMTLERFDDAIQLLAFIYRTLDERKETFSFSKHIWDYLFITTNEYIYTIYDNITPNEVKEFKINKEKILSNILKKEEWISDPIFLVEVIDDYIKILLEKSDYSMSQKYYHWIEQLMFYYWDLFTDESNLSLLQEINELKKRIESQHFI